jgi:hypothetical protein
VPDGLQVWFFCQEHPEVAESQNTCVHPTLYWKREHAFVLKEDPGNGILEHALRYLQRSRYRGDPQAQPTASLSRKVWSGNVPTYLELLSEVSTEDNLDCDLHTADDTLPHYGFQPVSIGDVARVFATPQKRKQAQPTRISTSEGPSLQHHFDAYTAVDNAPNFGEAGAEAIQCTWCERWRFISPEYHEIPPPAGFECWQLVWKDGVKVGLSCECEEQEWRPPNPQDPHAVKLDAESEVNKFFAFWKSTSENPEDIQTDDNQVYRENYWEYLAHMDYLVPEGYADHPTNTVHLDDVYVWYSYINVCGDLTWG